MKKMYLLMLIPAMFILNGCFKTEAPKCSNTDVKNTLKELYTQQMEKSEQNIFMQVMMASVPKTMTKINSARAVAYDENINLRSCKAEATLGKDMAATIEYTVQLDEKNNDQFYIELQMDFLENVAQQGMMNQFMNEGKK